MKPFGMIKHTHTNKQWKQYWLAACKSYWIEWEGFTNLLMPNGSKWMQGCFLLWCPSKSWHMTCNFMGLFSIWSWLGHFTIFHGEALVQKKSWQRVILSRGPPWSTNQPIVMNWPQLRPMTTSSLHFWHASWRSTPASGSCHTTKARPDVSLLNAQFQRPVFLLPVPGHQQCQHTQGTQPQPWRTTQYISLWIQNHVCYSGKRPKKEQKEEEEPFAIIVKWW